jgi:hypothetical protein
MVAAAQWLVGSHSNNVTPFPAIKVIRKLEPPPPPPPAGGLWKDLWDEGRNLWGTLGITYLTGPKSAGHRGLVLPPKFDDGSVLRFHPHCPSPRSGKAGGRYVPTILALYRNVHSDAPQAVLRIGLRPDGRKYERWDLGRKLEAAIKLMPATNRICLAEGVETALAAAMLGLTPIWAAGGRAGMAKFPLIDGVDELGLLVDHDIEGDSQRDAAEAFDTWTADGRDVWFDMPETPGQDFNDLVG